MGVSLVSGYTHCWRCGAHRLVDVLVKITDLPYWKAIDLTKGLAKQKVEVKKRGTLKIPKGVSKMLRHHREYLRWRGFDHRTVERLWGVQGFGVCARFSWRLFIPIVFDGEVVSWTTRSTGRDNGGLRYISASSEEESVNHKLLLYGEDMATHSIVIVEGPTDAWKIGPGAVATLGIGYSKQQVLRMSKYPVRAVVFDSEKEAQGRARRLCDELEVFPGSTLRIELDAKDPGSATYEEVRKLRLHVFGEA
jgi:DNA primase